MSSHHAVDLDGTLAHYDEYIPGHIGEPIPEMVSRINDWLSSGDDVTIFTARLKEHPEDEQLIQGWLETHVGQSLPVTNEKDPSFTDIWDDRAVAVEKNTGQILGADSQTGFSNTPNSEGNDMMGVGSLAGALKEKVKKFGKRAKKGATKLYKHQEKMGYRGAFGGLRQKRTEMD